MLSEQRSAEKAYVLNNKGRFIAELVNFLKIPSISAQSKHSKDVYNAAKYVKDELRQSGASDTRLISTDTYPLVYAEKFVGKDLPTLLVYGHYDVQPPEPYELWHSPPFGPEIRNNKIYARGASDDKGQIYIHFKALETLLSTNSLSCNLKFIIEGEEETGSVGINKFLDSSDNIELLKSDAIVVSDTAMLSEHTPSIAIGLRGIVTMDIEVIGPNRDLHSGVYGGSVANPIEVLCGLISSLKNNRKQIDIKEFYDDVQLYSNMDREKINEVPFDLKAYEKDLGINCVEGEEGFTTLERVGIRPSLTVNGIWGGYTEQEGFKTVLPSKAFAKLSLRLVTHQDSAKAANIIKEFIISKAPKSVQVEVHIHKGGSNALVTDSNSKILQIAARAIEKFWKKEPKKIMEGGSIPILSKFNEKLKVPIVILGFGFPSDDIHSPNENFSLDSYFKGIFTTMEFYKNFREACNT